MFITELNRELTGRQLDVWRGRDDAGNPIDMPAELQDAYRRKWITDAANGNTNGNTGVTPAQKSEPVCRHMGAVPLERTGCGSCAPKWKYPCELYAACSPEGQWPGAQRCRGCGHRQADDDAPTRPTRRVVLASRLCPGDAVVFGAAVDALHAAHPGRFLTALDTAAPELWDYHPNVVPNSALPAAPDGGGPWEVVPVHYPLIDRSDAIPVHFIQGYCHGLEQALGVRVPLAANRPRLHLSAEEKAWASQVSEVVGAAAPYWVVNAGRKRDYTAKWWGRSAYQEVVDRLRGRVLFAQVGEDGHDHPPLSGVIDLRGKTDVRQLMRLVHHSLGGLGPSTFLQHLCAALDRRYVLVAGGREPVAWQHYPRQTTFSTVGRLDCCSDRACWRSRTVKLGDGDDKDKSTCALPVIDAGGDWVPRCLGMIFPKDVANVIGGR